MSDERVNVALSDGTPGTAPEAVAKSIVADGGRVMSAKEVATIEHQQDLAERYNPLKHPLTAGASAVGTGLTGWWRGLTAGASDVALSKAGDALGLDARGTLKEWKDVHPALSTLEEMSGFAGGAAVGGQALGIGEAATVGGRVLQGAARGAGEMAIYEGGKAASDAALANEDITAQKVIAAGKHGLVMGLIGGGALSLAGEGLMAGRAAVRGGGEAIERPGLSRIAESAPAGSLREQLGQKALDISDEHAIKALRGSAGDVSRLNERVTGGAARVAQDVRAVTREATGKITPTLEETGAAVEKKIGELTENKFGMLRKLDESGALAPDFKAVADRARQELVVPHLGQNGMPVFGAEGRVKAVEEAISRLETSPPKTFEQWSKSITGFSEGINWNQMSKAEVSAQKQFRKFLSDELNDAGDRAASALGESFSDQYGANQKMLQSLIEGQKLVARGLGKNANANSFGLTSRIAGIVGGASGALGAGPLGGVIGGGAGALAGKFIQNKGDMLAAELLEHVAGVMGVRRMVATTDARVASGVASMLGKGRAANDVPRAASSAFAGRNTTPRAKFDAIEKQLTQLRANPAAATARIEQSLGDIPQRAPKLSQALVTATMRGAEYLTSKLPTMRKDTMSLQPQLQKGKVSPTEVSKFLRTAEAVNNPMIVLSEARRGTLTRDHVEAVKAVYPDVYEQIRETVMREVIDTKHQLPYSRRIQLGILLDIPTDRTLAPDFVRAMQATYSAPDSRGNEAPPTHNLAQLDVASSLATSTQSASMEGLER